jgi:isopropylmalate/homocitrate/citramalate synthase
MADHESLLNQLTHDPELKHISFPVLTPNMRGYENALAAGAKEVAVFAAASETFAQKNTNCSIDESLHRFQPILEHAKSEGIKVRGYVSCVMGCPYEGEISGEKVIHVCEQLISMGCYEVSIGDTIGVGTPGKTKHLLKALSNAIPVDKIAVHFHDTYGQALANICVALDHGIRVIDSSVAGLGGCPYAKGASGNVATEDVVYMLHKDGFQCGVDIDALIEAGLYICEFLQKTTQSKVARALHRA